MMKRLVVKIKKAEHDETAFSKLINNKSKMEVKIVNKFIK